MTNPAPISQKKAILMLAHLKATHQYFCFTDYGTFYTAEELLATVKGRKVEAQEVIDYLTA